MFVTAVAALLVAQGQVAVFGLSEDGLAAAGWITLAATLTRYADRADQILATTIYPAIVRVRDRADVLEELFAKSNRLTLMWAFPFGAGPGAVRRRPVVFVLGDEWGGAIVLLGGLAVAAALQQLGYNWFAFYRARGESWPQAVESAAFAGVVRACWRCRARCCGGPGASSPGGSACTVCVLGGARASTCGGCCRACAWARWRCAARCRCCVGDGAGAGAAARAVGRGADARAGAGRSSRCGSPGSRSPRAGSRRGLLRELRGYLRPAASGRSCGRRRRRRRP